MAVKARFETTVSKNMVVLVEPTQDLHEKHGVCLAKDLTPLTPEASEEQLLMANTMDQDVCDPQMEAEDMTQARLVGATSNRWRESQTSRLSMEHRPESDC